MLKRPMDVLTQFPVRKNKQQKSSFRKGVADYAEHLGYTVTEETGKLGDCNVILGDPETAKYLVTAHYDMHTGDNTSSVVTLLEIARTLPGNQRHKVCFVLFDLEEAGLLGSSFYNKKHIHQVAHQLVLNLDCVGDGNEIVMFPTKKLKTNACYMNTLRRVTGTWGQKQIRIREKGFAYYPSDQKHFPNGVGIAAFHRSSWAGLYLGRIHTKKDTILEETNVNILRAAIISLITCSAVK